MFTIPMRGNELQQALPEFGVESGFTIPMRGNEIFFPPLFTGSFLCVYDPHEG